MKCVNCLTCRKKCISRKKMFLLSISFHLLIQFSHNKSKIIFTFQSWYITAVVKKGYYLLHFWSKDNCTWTPLSTHAVMFKNNLWLPDIYAQPPQNYNILHHTTEKYDFICPTNDKDSQVFYFNNKKTQKNSLKIHKTKNK